MTEALPCKTALVTGATEGIGQATAWALADAGHDVIVTDLATASLAETIDGIAARGRRALSLPLDLREEASISALLPAAEQAFGPIGVLVNNAGCTLGKAAVDVTWSEWDQVMDVNLKGGYFLSARMAARCMAEQRPGAIIPVIGAASATDPRQLYRFCAEYGDAAKGIDLRPVSEGPVGASAALVSSGTMSLTVALAGIPGAVVYRANPLTWVVGRRLIAGRVDHLGIANILLKRPAWPEYLQSACEPRALAVRLSACVDDPSTRQAAVADAAELHAALSARSGSTPAEWAASFLRP